MMYRSWFWLEKIQENTSKLFYLSSFWFVEVVIEFVLLGLGSIVPIYFLLQMYYPLTVAGVFFLTRFEFVYFCW
jgi:hypothetical protein